MGEGVTEKRQRVPHPLTPSPPHPFTPLHPPRIQAPWALRGKLSAYTFRPIMDLEDAVPAALDVPPCARRAEAPERCDSPRDFPARGSPKGERGTTMKKLLQGTKRFFARATRATVGCAKGACGLFRRGDGATAGGRCTELTRAALA